MGRDFAGEQIAGELELRRRCHCDSSRCRLARAWFQTQLKDAEPGLKSISPTFTSALREKATEHNLVRNMRANTETKNMPDVHAESPDIRADGLRHKTGTPDRRRAGAGGFFFPSLEAGIFRSRT